MRKDSIHKFQIGFVGDGVIENFAKDNGTGCIIDIEEVIYFRKSNFELAKNAYYAVIADSDGKVYVTPAAMKMLSKKDDYSKKLVALALMVNNIVNKIAGNFYLTMFKPNTNTRLFTDRKLAISWLEDEVRKANLEN